MDARRLAAVRLAAVLLCHVLDARPCFSRVEDFLPGALRGRFRGLSEAEWTSEVLANRRMPYGNLTCLAEEETHACGRDVGAWSWVRDDPLKAPRARANARYANAHVVLEPDACALRAFDAAALDRILSGGRRLLICGDSTARQLFAAFACAIPPALRGAVDHPEGPGWRAEVEGLPADERAVWTRGGHGLDEWERAWAAGWDQPGQGKPVSLKLAGGGFIKLRGFEDFWYVQPPANMAKLLFQDCGGADICVHRPTMHHVNGTLEAAGLDGAHAAIAAIAADATRAAWPIALAPNVPHYFGPDHSGATMSTGKEPCSHGDYSIGAANFSRGVEPGCRGHVCPSERELALSRVRAMKLPLAILGGDMLYDVGAAHVSPAAENKKGQRLQQDCQHWCAPGINDALAGVIASLIVEHDGDPKRFHAAMVARE